MSKKLRFAMRRAMSGVLHTSQCVSDVMSLLLIPTPCTPAYSPAGLCPFSRFMSVCGMCFAEAHLGETSLNGNCYVFEEPADQAKWRGRRTGGASGRAPRPTAPPGAARGGRGVEPRGETGAEKGAAFRVIKSGGAGGARTDHGEQHRHLACRSRPL